MSLTRTTIGELDSLRPDVAALTGALPFDLDDLDPDGPLLYATGSASLDELVVEENCGILVAGDLVIEGLFDSRPLSFDPEDVRFVVTGGDLRAKVMLTASETLVGGSLTVGELLIAESDGHLTLRVAGDLEGPRLIALGHHVAVGGDTRAELAIGYLGLACDIPKSQMGATFVPDVVNQWGGIDIEEVARRALAGEPYLAIDAR